MPRVSEQLRLEDVVAALSTSRTSQTMRSPRPSIIEASDGSSAGAYGPCGRNSRFSRLRRRHAARAQEVQRLARALGQRLVGAVAEPLQARRVAALDEQRHQRLARRVVDRRRQERHVAIERTRVPLREARPGSSARDHGIGGSQAAPSENMPVLVPPRMAGPATPMVTTWPGIFT